ncbi:MAG: HEPN domain-containing protein [Patescibacteria group bacterium]|nr:HEPN domain-containing protein [Patescibacteria group bacterium]
MKPLIDKLKKAKLIAEEKIGFDQIVKHLERARKDLKVAEANLKIDSEASYNYAYLAMLRSGRAIMFSFGFRPIDGQQHKTVVSFAEAVLGKEFSELAAAFDRMRKFRNRFTYDEPGILVSLAQTEQSLKNAKQFVERATNFIKNKDPQKRLF